jgi:hypothetical protein
MMYDSEFERCFLKRTLQIVSEYNGQLEATLLLNCLLGLLIVPKEKLFDLIPSKDISSFEDWGISKSTIKQWGKCSEGHEHRPTLNQLIRHLRNAVAHFKVKPISGNGDILAFEFEDGKFKIRFEVNELKIFTSKLSEYILTKTKPVIKT